MALTGTLLLVGATSDMGRAVALRYAGAGWRILLAARDMPEAVRTADDIATRTGATVSTHKLDILATGRFDAFLDGLPAPPDTVVCVVGALGDQVRGQADMAHAALVLRTNFEGPALLLGAVAERFQARGRGAIIGVSSVAGDRGRASNYIYGSAKAGLSAYLAGLRHRLARSGVVVVTIKPGFVRTRMTASMALPALLIAEPDEVAAAIFAADQAGKAKVLYVRRVWRAVMAAVRALPEPVFVRTRL